jgi:hypothetical protein
MNVRYRVELSQNEGDELKALVGGGRHAARKLRRPQTLLAADAGVSDEEIARSVGVRWSVSTKAPPSSSPRFASQSRPSRGSWSVTTVSISALAPPTCSSFLTCVPWRKVKLTDSRTAMDFATCTRELVDVHFPKAERIRVVLDNLSTHTAGALYQVSRLPKPIAFCTAWSSTTTPRRLAG